MILLSELRPGDLIQWISAETFDPLTSTAHEREVHQAMVIEVQDKEWKLIGWDGPGSFSHTVVEAVTNKFPFLTDRTMLCELTLLPLSGRRWEPEDEIMVVQRINAIDEIARFNLSTIPDITMTIFREGQAVHEITTGGWTMAARTDER